MLVVAQSWCALSPMKARGEQVGLKGTKIKSSQVKSTWLDLKIKSVITDLTWLDLKIKSGISHLTWLDLKIKSVLADLNMTWELSVLIIFQFTPLILLYDLLLLLIHHLSTIEIVWALLEHSRMVFNLIIWRRPDQIIGCAVMAYVQLQQYQILWQC